MFLECVYRSTDIFALCSLQRSYPLALLSRILEGDQRSALLRDTRAISLFQHKVRRQDSDPIPHAATSVSRPCCLVLFVVVRCDDNAAAASPP
jgi:hypothetical protein